ESEGILAGLENGGFSGFSTKELLVPVREPAHEHLSNALQLLETLMDAVSSSDPPDLKASDVRQHVFLDLTAIRNRIAAAQGIIQEVKDEETGLVPGMRTYNILQKVRTLL